MDGEFPFSLDTYNMWDESCKNKNITKKQRDTLFIELEYFYSRVKIAHVITYLNGFVGTGALVKPTSHITPNINKIWIYNVGFNLKGDKIIPIYNAEMTVDEAEDQKRCLQKVLGNFSLKERKDLPELKEKMTS